MVRYRLHPTPKLAPRHEQPVLQKHSQLTPVDIQSLASKLRSQFNWDNDPRPFQLDAIKAQLEGTDIIIQAPTGSGKTAIAAGPHVWYTADQKKISIMVCPLLALEEEMVWRFPLSSYLALTHI